MLASFHACGTEPISQALVISWCSLLNRLSPPCFHTSAGIPSPPGALPSFRLAIALAISSIVGISSRLVLVMRCGMLSRASWSMHYRIIFKMCTIAYQALSSTQPAYLNSMLTPTRNSRQLRSTSSNPLHIPRVKTKAGTRAFSVAAPTVWNSLPASVKSQGNIVSFRRHLKTYLFNAAYPP